MHLLSVALFAYGFQLLGAYESNLTYVPKGDYPIFYPPDQNTHVINLDQETFDDTVFNHKIPIMVEVYKDW